MKITKDWCDVIELGYQADNANSCVENPLQPILLVLWNNIEQGVAVDESRCQNGVYHDTILGSFCTDSNIHSG